MNPDSPQFRTPALSGGEPFKEGHRTNDGFMLGGEEADIARHEANYVESPAENAARERSNASYRKQRESSDRINKIIEERRKNGGR